MFALLSKGKMKQREVLVRFSVTALVDLNLLRERGFVLYSKYPVVKSTCSLSLHGDSCMILVLEYFSYTDRYYVAGNSHNK